MRLTRPTYQRALALPAALLGLAAPASGAGVGQTLVVRGAGFGHGVGMSQQGALGFARHGWTYAAILGHYYTATALGPAPPGQVVRVLVQANRPRVAISGASRVNGTRLDPKVTYTLRLAAGGRVVTLGTGSHGHVTAPLLRLRGAGPVTLRGPALNGVTGGAYRGALEVRPAAHGGLNAIDAVGLEDYVRGVVAGEMEPASPAAALDAQAVASRTFALTAHAGPAGVFDVYADTRSQLYRGVAGEQRRSDAAVQATAGQIVTYAGRPAITYFFDSSGGWTENVENALPGAAAEPWLRGVEDPYDGGPQHSWGPLRFSFADAARRLGGLVRGGFAGIEVLRRGVSPRILRAYVLGSAGATPVTGDELAARLGLYDTWAYFSVADAGGVEHSKPDRSGPASAGGGAPAGGTAPTGGAAPGAGGASPPTGTDGGTPAG